jgi:hypothetical protein
MAVADPWACPSCNGQLSTPFCSACGEGRPDARDLTMRGLVRGVFNAFSDIDGRLIRSILCLLSKPGRLTSAYVSGIRLRYIGPFQLFLIANVIFFATQSLTGTSVFSSSLDSHLNNQDWSAIARELVAHRLETTQTPMDRYAPVFDQAAVMNAKSLIILMAIPFSLLLPLLFFGSGRPFVAHVVFSLHVHAFLLLLLCLSLIISAASARLGGPGLDSARMDNYLTLFNLTVMALHLYFATGEAYATRGFARLARVLALTVAIGVTISAYRFAIFLITLYST